MIGVVLFLLVLAAIALIIYTHSQPRRLSPPPNPEHVMKAAVELHRIRRRLDASDLKHRQRRDAAELKREIGEALEGDEGP
jgi:hypothetical protein